MTMGMDRRTAQCRVDCRNTLGEGCAWDPRDGSLYWTDIQECRILRLGSDGASTTFELPERAAFILPRRGSGFVIGFASRIAVADASLSTFTTLAVIEPELPQTRVNDAAVDPSGGIVFGTFDERDRQPGASLYRIAPNGVLTCLLDGVTISNGIAFSPDGATLYFRRYARRHHQGVQGWPRVRDPRRDRTSGRTRRGPGGAGRGDRRRPGLLLERPRLGELFGPDRSQWAPRRTD